MRVYINHITAFEIAKVCGEIANSSIFLMGTKCLDKNITRLQPFFFIFLEIISSKPWREQYAVARWQLCVVWHGLWFNFGILHLEWAVLIGVEATVLYYTLNLIVWRCFGWLYTSPSRILFWKIINAIPPPSVIGQLITQDVTQMTHTDLQSTILIGKDAVYLFIFLQPRPLISAQWFLIGCSWFSTRHFGYDPASYSSYSWMFVVFLYCLQPTASRPGGEGRDTAVPCCKCM